MSKPLVQNAADEKQVKKAERKKQSERERHALDIQFLLKTDEGQRVFWKYLSHCKVFEECFTGNSHTFYNEGRRSVGLMILADITKNCPEVWIEMMQKRKGEIKASRS